MQPQRRELTWEFDPLEVLARWPDSKRAMLLHSGRFDRRWSRQCILAEPVGFYQYVSEGGGKSQWRGLSQDRPACALVSKLFPDLRSLLGATSNEEGLWIGYLSYELGRFIETLPPRVPDDRNWPVVELGYCPGYLVYEIDQQTWYACGRYAVDSEPDLTSAPIYEVGYAASKPVSVFSRRDYEAAVGQVLEYIGAGDVFQVNLAQRFTAHWSGQHPWSQRTLFRILAGISPAWYGAYLELDGQRVIASTSPELFLNVDQTGRVISRPIKGTRPAAVSPEKLRHSGKDIAELNMIVDLMRNDLGRVCAYGSIDVPLARTIESHPMIHHGVATISGQLHESKDVVDLLRAAMPGGSVTGAPKVRAMQIIDELEPVRRGPYCGSIGYLSQAATCLNIAIRTMLIDAGRQLVDYSVGGGIVADSEPSAEYDETLDKAAAMLAALNAAGVIGQSRSGGMTKSARLAEAVPSR